MGSPNVTSNYQGYAEADICNKVEHLRNKMFYLVHGAADDNVQFQQSMILAYHLAKKGILFRQQVTLSFHLLCSCINKKNLHISVTFVYVLIRFGLNRYLELLQNYLFITI
jgi:hypothetical protein